jgi:hemolysin III
MSTRIQTTVTVGNPHGIDGGDMAQIDTADEAQQQPPRVYAEDFPEAVVDGVEKFLGKPRLRGWIHVYAAVIAFIAGAALVSVSWSLQSTRAGIATLLYTLTIVAMFAVSGTYHRVHWTSATARKWMKRADHSMIFIFIAGTYTPFCLLLLPGPAAGVLLAVVWTGALGGVAMKVIRPHAPRWASAPLYLGLGWVAVAVLPDILGRGGVTALVLLLVGGAAYSAGAIFYALRRPDPWPAVFGHHEFFHACTIVAALCHHIAVYFALFA